MVPSHPGRRSRGVASRASRPSRRTPAAGPRAAESEADPTRLEPVLTSEGRALLDELGDVSGQDPLAVSTRLRALGHSADVVAAVLTQAGLRARARAKLGEDAAGLLLTRDGLEQATRPVVARVHAQRLREAGARRVADLGCGLGLDSLAFARAGLEVTAVEKDPTVAAAAAANLAAHAGAHVETGDAVAWAGEHLAEPAPGEAVWLDPARRRIGGGGTARVFDPEAFSPPLSFVEALAARGCTVGVKLGPGIPHEALSPEAEAQWVSVDGDVTEAVLWFGAARRPGVRRAALALDTRGGQVCSAELVSAEPPGGSPAVSAVGEEGMAGLVGHLLLEPDGAVIRAGLVTDLAVGLGPEVRLLDEHLAYLTAPEVPAHPLARRYRVLAVQDLNLKALKRWAAETGVGRLDVKKRGVALAPEQVRARVLGSGRSRGGRHATLVLARVGEGRYALEVEPLDDGGAR
ncbi:class I SAM-dependent methyltransferase [Micrococcus sp.]|uniref:class I SAM-dependent methyltransferase n=1 Tax=Micrococcus sp. TaxID=1271 RepID=UPI002A920B24|nr:class I SAM-dependent methyltransferase [Micrococcus sp.]MDY6055826.1 class I SAM-dependent methyltransferase [Micrococcus sp.]